MVVVEQLHPLLRQRRAGFVQAFCQVVPGGCIGVSKAVHTGDDHMVCAETLGLGCDGRGVPLDTAEIGVQADDRKPRFLHEFVPVQFAAVAVGIPAARVSSRTIRPVGWIINPQSSIPVYPAALRAASVCRGLGFIVEGGAQHELLHAGWDHGEASFLQDKHGAGGDAVFVEAVHGNVVACPAIRVVRVASFAP